MKHFTVVFISPHTLAGSTFKEVDYINKELSFLNKRLKCHVIF